LRGKDKFTPNPATVEIMFSSTVLADGAEIEVAVVFGSLLTVALAVFALE
jgi:hypothetical protein